MPIYDGITNANYGNRDAQDIAIRAFLGLFKDRVDESDFDDGFYYQCEKSGDYLVPTGANTEGFYISPLLTPNYDSSYARYFNTRFKHLVYKATLHEDVGVSFYHSTARRSSNGGAPYCLYFDGSNDYVEVSDASGLTPAGAVSFDFYLNLTHTQDYKPILQKANEYRVRTRYSGGIQSLEFGVYIAAAWTNTTIAGWTTGLDLNTWYHIRCVYDGAEIRIYVDGVEQPGAAAIAGAITETGNDLILGWDEATNYLHGFVDGLMGYAGVLATANFQPPEISGPPPAERTNTMFLYYMDEGSGATIYDRSGNDYDGTIHGATFYPDGYGWTEWTADENSTLITDLWYIDPPANTADSAKALYYRFKLAWTRVAGTETMEFEYIDTYYQGEVTDFVRKVDREQQAKEVTGTQPLMGFTLSLANGVIPGTEQVPDRYFNFDSTYSAFASVLNSSGCVSIQVGFRNENGQVDYWRPYIDDLKTNIRSVTQTEDGVTEIKGVLCKGLTKDSVDIPLIENVKYNDLIRDYLIKKDDEDYDTSSAAAPETEYDRYVCDFVDETGEKSLSSVSEWVGESKLCPDWGEDTPGVKDDPDNWILPNVCVHAACSDEKYLYVVFKTSLQHLEDGVKSCLQIRRCNKDGSAMPDGILGNIFCDDAGGGGTWDDTNLMVAGGICTDDEYVYVSYFEKAGDDLYYSAIGRLKKTGQNLYGNASAPGDDDFLRNRYYYDTQEMFLPSLQIVNGVIAAANGGTNYLWFFASSAAGGTYNSLDIDGINWANDSLAPTEINTYGAGNYRGYGLLIDNSTPTPSYRCTFKDIVNGEANLSTLVLTTGVLDTNTTTGACTKIADNWDDNPGTVEFLWNICVIGQYIYGSMRSTEYVEGDQPEDSGINGLGLVARYGYWLESGQVQVDGATDHEQIVMFPHPLITVGGQLMPDPWVDGTVANDILTTDAYWLDLNSGEIWFKRAPGSEVKESLPSGIYDEDGELKERSIIRASYDFQPCLQLTLIEKDTERWQAIQNVCDGAGYICCPSPDGRLKFRDRYTEKQIQLTDLFTVEHEIIYDEQADVDDTRVPFIGEELDGIGGTEKTECWIEFTAFKDMTIDRLSFMLDPIDPAGEPDFPDQQYVEEMAVNIEMGQMHAANDHTWATAGTLVKSAWDLPYVNPDYAAGWYYTELDTPFSCTAGVTYGIRITVASSKHGAVCQWAIRADDTPGDAVTRYSYMDGTGGWTNLDYAIAVRLESSYCAQYEIGTIGTAENQIIYTPFQEYGQYIDLVFEPSRNIAAGEILYLTASDVSFPNLIAAGDIQLDGRDLRVAYSSDGIHYNEIDRVAVYLASANNARVYFVAQAAMTSGSKYPQSYRLYIDNARACPAPETVNGLIYDKFDERDVSDWTSVSGTWRNHYQKMHVFAVGNRQKFINDTMEAWDEQDMVAEATVRHTQAGAAYSGVMVRYLDANNYVAGYIQEDTDTAYITVMHGGVWGGVGFEASAAYANVPATDYRLRLIATGTDFYLYINGTLIVSLSCNFGDDPTYDQAGLFGGGAVVAETLDYFIAYRYYGAQPTISGVLAHNLTLRPSYDTINVIDYNRKKTFVRNTDYYLAASKTTLYIKRIDSSGLDDEDIVYTQYVYGPIYDFWGSTKRSLSDDRYGNSVTVIGHRRFPSDVPLTVTKYMDVPKRKPTDESICLSSAASPVQRIYGSKQEDWRDDEGQFNTDTDLSGFGMDIEFEAPFILGDPLIVVRYGDASEWYGAADVPFNYPLPSGFDGGNWDGVQVYDGTGLAPSIGELYFKAVRIGYTGSDDAEFPQEVPPLNIRIGNYREWRKFLGATWMTPGAGDVVFRSFSGDGWYWQLKHMNDNYKGLGTKLLWYPTKSVVLAASGNITTISNLIKSQRKSVYVEITPVDYYGNALFDDSALNPNGDDIADEHKLHIVSAKLTSDGIKIRALNRTNDVQRIRVVIYGYQANINKVLQVVAEDDAEIAAHGRRKLEDFDSQYISTSPLGYRRAAEILALNMSEEEQPKDVELHRFHVDLEAYDIISLTDKDAALDKSLYRVLGWRDSLSIDGYSQTTATSLMRLPAQ